VLEAVVEPDHFYHSALGDWRNDKQRSTEGRVLLEQAYAEAERSAYWLLEERLSLGGIDQGPRQVE
jgi:hypothetical protein